MEPVTGAPLALGVPGLVKLGSVGRNSAGLDWMTKSVRMMFLIVRLPLLTVEPGLVVDTVVWVAERYSPSTTKAERVCRGRGRGGLRRRRREGRGGRGG